MGSMFMYRKALVWQRISARPCVHLPRAGVLSLRQGTWRIHVQRVPPLGTVAAAPLCYTMVGIESDHFVRYLAAAGVSGIE
jgi:hypothetical protein